MKITKLLIGALALTIIAAAAPAYAAGPVTSHFYAGVNLPQGDSGNALDDGWSIGGGATWFRPASNLGLRFDLGVDWWDVRNELLRELDTAPNTPGIQPPDDGDARTWRGGLGLVWEPTRGRDGIGFYVTAGLDLHYASYDIGEYVVVPTYWCDWWWGVCYPGYGTGEAIVASDSSWEWGANAGIGITFPMGGGEQQLYVEATYRWMDTEQSAEFLPIVLGVRW
jgi:hypothetical protein